MAAALGFRFPSEAWTHHERALAWLAEVTEAPPVPEPRTAPDPVLAAWAAGFLDGEGCIFGYERIAGGYRRFSFGIQVAQAVREPLDLLQQTWGGAVRFQKKQQSHYRDQWSWTISGEDGARFLTDVLPYLRVKAESARVAIPCLFRTHKHGVPFTDDEVIGRQAAVVVLRRLNQRGKAVA